MSFARSIRQTEVRSAEPRAVPRPSAPTPCRTRPSQIPVGQQRALDDRSPGRPLDGPLRNELGEGFAHVRVHTDPGAGRLAAGIDADAFTRGSDIYFARGRYSNALLRHELGHVVQQARGDVSAYAGQVVPASHSSENHPERELRAASAPAPTGAAVLQRQPPGSRPEALSLDELLDMIITKRGLESRVPPHAVEAAQDRERDAHNRLADAKAAHKDAVRARRDQGDVDDPAGRRARRETRGDVSDVRQEAQTATKRAQSAELNASESFPDEGAITPNRQELGHGTRTFGAIQVTDENGRRVALGVASYHDDLHAEEHALTQIRGQLRDAQVDAGAKPGRNWRVTVVVDQTVCPDRCRPALRKFADDYGVDPKNVVAYYPERVTGRQVTPKTASRSAHVNPVRLSAPEQVLDEPATPSGGGGGGGGGGGATGGRVPSPPVEAGGDAPLSPRAWTRMKARGAAAFAGKAVGAALSALPFLMALRQLQSALATVDTFEQQMVALESASTEATNRELGLDQLPAPNDLRRDHVHFEKSMTEELDWLAKNGDRISKSFGSASSEDMRMFTGVLSDLEDWINDLNDLNVACRVYSEQIGSVLSEVMTRSSALSAFIGNNNRMMKSSSYFPQLEEILLQIDQTSLQVARQLGRFQSALVTAQEGYDHERSRARNDWLQLVNVYNKYRPAYVEYVRAKGYDVSGNRVEFVIWDHGDSDLSN
ncbi:MAG TPA: DUF4157 domain-containing protein [Gaiellaceae bacterium]|nr:DUF4157 domain-containing protein [Gaiellaceae bacterium]